MAKPPHPFQKWMTSEGLKDEDVAAMCAKLGRPVGKAWIKQIRIGWDRPSFFLAEFLSARVTRNKVSVDDFMHARTTKRGVSIRQQRRAAG
jgi:hypothetical protein